MASNPLMQSNAFRLYAGIGILLLLLLVYAAIPKAAPVNSISVSGVKVMERTNGSALIVISASWDFQSQLTYLAFDVQPKGAPANISRADFAKYHLIRQPQNWINVRTVYDKKGAVDYQAVIETSGSKDFNVFVKGANEEGDLALNSSAFSLEPRQSIQ